MEICLTKLEDAHGWVPNLRVVTPNFVRGGQPEPEGLKALSAAGVKAVVNLCSTDDGLRSLFRSASGSSNETPEIAKERKLCQDLGMTFHALPLYVFREPPQAAIERFLEIISEQETSPVFLHCLHGRDRTGMMAAIYRVTYDRWPVEKAYEEMLDCGHDTNIANLSAALFAYARKLEAHK